MSYSYNYNLKTMTNMKFFRRLRAAVIFSLLAAVFLPELTVDTYASDRQPSYVSAPRPGDKGKPGNNNGHPGSSPSQSVGRPGSNHNNGNKQFERNRREAEKMMRKADEYQRKADTYNFEARKCLREAEQHRHDARRFADMRDYRNAQRADSKAERALDNYSKYSCRAKEASRLAAEYRQKAAFLLR